MKEKEKKKLAFDDSAEKRGADELMNRCEYSLQGRALEKARRMYRKCMDGLYALLESHPMEPRPESRVERILRKIFRRRDS